MKLTHLAAGAIVLLLLVAGYLLMQTESDKRESRMQDKINALNAQLDKIKQGHPAPAETPAAAAAPAVAAAKPGAAESAAPAPTADSAKALPAPTPAVNPSAGSETPAASADAAANPGVSLPALDLNAKEAQVIANIQKMQTPPEGELLNDLQKKIKNLPAIGNVKTFNQQHSFAVIDAGKKANLAPGMKFQVRRGAMLIGKATIGSTIEDAEAIADIDPATIPVGVEIKPGDQLVQFDGR